jgi:subtilase family protein
LREDLAGVEPELALVIETYDTVERFQRAVERIGGMEWLIPADVDEIPADEDFYLETSKHERLDRPVGGTLFLVMTDRRAVEQVLSLWNRFQADQNYEFPRGLTPWRELFRNLRAVRLWGPEDRLAGTGILEQWRERLAAGDQRLRAHIELWYRRSEADRRRQLDDLTRRLAEAGGTLLGQDVVIGAIAYHGCIAEIPRDAVEQVLQGAELALVRAEGVMYYRPTGQFAAPPVSGEVAETAEAPVGEPPTAGDATIALLDGLPLEGHVLLHGRLVVDDPDEWGPLVPAAQRRHGTAMASLILRGDPPGPEVLRKPLYVRPILVPDDAFVGLSYEKVPDSVLEVDLVHRAVRRAVVGEAEYPAAAPGIVIVNLSVGDPSRPFSGPISPMARLLDWLASEHGLLFVVSAGNPGATLPLELECERGAFGELSAEELQRLTVQAIVKQAHTRGLLAPAESVNALTVGATHQDAAGPFDPRGRVDPFRASERGGLVPSPIGSVGGGVGRSIKPEVFFPGGRSLYRERLGTTHDRATLEPSSQLGRAPGQQVASPGPAGELARTAYTCGTSNAAALATRAAGRILEALPELVALGEGEARPSRHHAAALLKSLIVHSARWGETQQLFEELLAAPLGQVTRAKLGRFLGFGFADESRLLGCTEQRVTLVGWDDISDGEGHLFRVPMPPSLSGQQVYRRLTVSLAWNSPINPYDKRYRRAQVWFVPKEPNGFDSEELLRVRRREADQRAASRGTVQHEIFEGDQTSVFGDTDELTLKVNCREHAGRLAGAIPYALAISLEVAPATQLPIYEEVRDRLQARVQVQPLRVG